MKKMKITLWMAAIVTVLTLLAALPSQVQARGHDRGDARIVRRNYDSRPYYREIAPRYYSEIAPRYYRENTPRYYRHSYPRYHHESYGRYSDYYPQRQFSIIIRR